MNWYHRWFLYLDSKLDLILERMDKMDFSGFQTQLNNLTAAVTAASNLLVKLAANQQNPADQAELNSLVSQLQTQVTNLNTAVTNNTPPA